MCGLRLLSFQSLSKSLSSSGVEEIYNAASRVLCLSLQKHHIFFIKTRESEEQEDAVK